MVFAISFFFLNLIINLVDRTRLSLFSVTKEEVGSIHLLEILRYGQSFKFSPPYM